MTTNNPVQDALNQAANNTAQAAEVISQTDNNNVVSVQGSNQNHAVTQHVASAPALSMDDSAVAAVSGVSGYIKLRDGGLELDEAKFGATKFKLHIENAQKGGSFQPCYCHNYNSPTGQVYTKSYDGVSTASNNPAHSTLPWNESVQLCLRQDPKSYTYLGFELTLELLEDTKSIDGKTTIPAGTKFGYTTPYTSSKLFKAIWDKSIGEAKRGQSVVIELQGEEVTSGKGQYKKLIVKEVS